MRQRRNKVAGAAMLPAEGAGATIQAPPLPDRGCEPCQAAGRVKLQAGDKIQPCAACGGSGIQPWHPLVLSWWADVWASPMASEFLKADTHGLFVLAELRDQFWHTGDRELAGEIRLQEQRFGLSSLDRRRLQWEVERAEQAQRRRPAAPATSGKEKRVVGDPRRFLRSIK